MKAEELAGWERKGYIEWILVNAALYLAWAALVGIFANCLAYVSHRRKVGMVSSWIGLSLSWIWLTVAIGLSIKQRWYLDNVLLAWLWMTPAYGCVGRAMSLLRRFTNWSRPKTLGEQLDELEARQEARERQLVDGVGRTPTVPSERGKLRIGRFVKGDSFWGTNTGIHNTNGWLVIDENVLDQHTFILGATGAGKSETLKRLIFEVLSSTDRDIYFVDGKGDEGLANEIRGLAQQFGRGLAPVFRMGHGQGGAIYDGFRGQAEDVYNRLCALIGLEEMEGGATYYADINRDLLQLICYSRSGPPRNFEQIWERLDKDWLLSDYANNPREKRTIENYSERDLSGLAVRLRPLIREFSKSVGDDGFALEDTRCAIFSLRTQSVGDTARRFLGFLVEDLKDFIGKRQRRPAVLIIDEYAQFPADSVLALLSLARSSHLGVILATQDTSTLGDENNRQRILSNTTTQILMKSNFPEDIGKMAGTRYQLESSIQHDEGEATGQGSARIQHAFKVDMNEVAKMSAGEAFLIRNRYACKLKVERILDIPQVAPQEPVERRAARPTAAAPTQQGQGEQLTTDNARTVTADQNPDEPKSPIITWDDL